MKIRREDYPIDPCTGSMTFLKERIESFFSENVTDSIQRFYPELDIFENQSFSYSDILDVVLFGNNIKSFFQSGLWPCRKYRIWTLSPQHKSFWDNVLFENMPESINVIPRVLLTKRMISNDLVTLKDKHVDLVFAGRLSAQKNITFLILLYKELELLDLDVRLYLYGKFDDQYDEIFGRRIHENYKESVVNLIQKLSFKNPPIINENLMQDEWTETPLENPVLISLSTYHCEDYGVSVTQAQEKGWPLILTDMLGHKSVHHSNLLSIPACYHLREHLPIDIKRIFAKDLARYLFETPFINNEKSDKAFTNITISDSDILSARKNLIKTRGTQLSLINSENVGLFYDTQVGLRFHLDFIKDQYKNIELYVFIVEDVDHKGVPHNIQSKLLELLNNESFYPYFISLKNLFKSKVELELLAEASKVVLLLDSKIQKVTLSKLVDTLGYKRDLFY